MEEKSLKVYDTEKTFFSKITNTLNKILAPGKMGLNSMIISMKRNNVLKNYEHYIERECYLKNMKNHILYIWRLLIKMLLKIYTKK